MNYAVHHYSHWQGASNPGSRVAVFASRETAKSLASELSTCSFCTPGRAAQYSTGVCYEVYPTRRPITDDTIEDAVIRLRDER